MIRFEHVSKSYKTVPVLRDISFEIADGELVAIIGASGCGKTTLLKMINKLVVPDAGAIHINGADITGLDTTSLRRQMGYVIQQTGLFAHMTVGRNIGIIPSLQKKPRSEISRQIDELLELVGLAPETYRDRYPSQLSGGQQQRVGVARAFATDPDIILMDEPFSALDPITRVQLQEELVALHRKLKKTIVFVTHDINEAIKIADRICILNQGVVEQFDTPENILLHPASEHVKQFIGAGRIWSFPQYLTVGHVLAEDYAACAPDTPLSAFGGRAPHEVYVTLETGELRGIVTHEALKQDANRTAGQAMQTAFTAVARQDRLSAALDVLDAKDLARAPVLDGERLCGYLSQKSIADHLFAHRDERERSLL